MVCLLRPSSVSSVVKCEKLHGKRMYNFQIVAQNRSSCNTKSVTTVPLGAKAVVLGVEQQKLISWEKV